MIDSLPFCPTGGSVNDGIPPEWCSLSYIKVDDVARHVAQLGSGALLAKMDIQQVYRMVPVHPDNRALLGMRWEGGVIYIDTRLPFG